jgi:S1-C subfamily serine protease
MILEVDPESDAAEQGLVPGLIVQAVNDRSVGDLAEWRRATKGVEPGDVVKLELWLPGDTTRSVFVRVPGGSAP